RRVRPREPAPSPTRRSSDLGGRRSLSAERRYLNVAVVRQAVGRIIRQYVRQVMDVIRLGRGPAGVPGPAGRPGVQDTGAEDLEEDRKSTRLNSSHQISSYAR